MYFYEAKFVPTEEELVILETPLSGEFPWFYTERIDHSNYALFNHFLIAMRKDNGNSPGIFRSPYAESFLKIFEKFCKVNGIKYNQVLRSAINCTLHYNDKMGPIHRDHSIPHCNFIMYLNEFTNGPTYIFDEDKKECKMTIPEKYKGVVFDGVYHSHGFCAPHERRVVLVVTFV